MNSFFKPSEKNFDPILNLLGNVSQPPKYVPQSWSELQTYVKEDETKNSVEIPWFKSFTGARTENLQTTIILKQWKP